MITKLVFNICISMFLFLSIPNLKAETMPEMTDFFIEQMVLVESELPNLDEVDGQDVYRYSLNRLLVDINPHVGFGIRGIATLTVNPEIQFMWERIPGEN